MSNKLKNPQSPTKLPKTWDEKTDPNGHIYYVDTETGEWYRVNESKHKRIDTNEKLNIITEQSKTDWTSAWTMSTNTFENETNNWQVNNDENIQDWKQNESISFTDNNQNISFNFQWDSNPLNDTTNIEIDELNDIPPSNACDYEPTSFQQYLISGYYRLNYGKYLSNYDNNIYIISILYIWQLEEFNPHISANHYAVTGVNNNICQSTSGTKIEFAFGQNIIYHSKIKKHNYYHWRFKVLNKSEYSAVNGYTIGIVENNYNQWIGKDLIKDSTAFLFHGNKGVKSTGNVTQAYGIKWNKNNHILDMYLNLNSGELSFVINNKSYGVAFSNINIEGSHAAPIRTPA
eukprot:417964_1